MKVFLFVVIFMPGAAPAPTTFPMQSVEQCLEGAATLLNDEDVRKMFEGGGALQTSCVIEFPPGSKS